jgi:trehalose transport system substrate-binding protein
MGRRILVSLVVLGVVATGCRQQTPTQQGGGGDLAGTTITFSTSLAQAETAAIQDLLPEFQRTTGAKVNLTAVTAADLPEKLKVEVPANNTIHLFAQDNVSLRVLVDGNLVEDLSDVELPDGIVPALVPAKFDGKQLFLPFRPNVRVAYVNKDRFESANADAPKTTTDLRATAEKLKAKAGAAKVTLSLADGDPGAVTISEWIVSFGGNPVLLNDEGSIKAFEFIQSLWKDNLLARESLLGKFDTEVDNLQGETAWFAQNWPFTTSELVKQGLISKFDVYEGYAGPDRAAHAIGGDVLGIPRGVSGDEKRAALALANFLISRETQQTLAEKNAWPSVRDDAYGQVPDDQKQTFEAIQEAMKDGWYRPNLSYWSDVSEQINVAITRVIENGENAKTVLDELHAKIEAAAKAKGAQYPPPTE